MSLHRFKVVMLGAPGVGKTSLVRRFVHSIFDDEYKSTLGAKVDRKNVEIEGKKVNLLLWDIHGETDGLVVTPSYLQGAHAALLVVDSTRPETVETSLALGLRAKDESPDIALYVVANKCDLLDDTSDVSSIEEQAGQFVTRTSAKTGEGVEDLFTSIARRAIQ